MVNMKMKIMKWKIEAYGKLRNLEVVSELFTLVVMQCCNAVLLLS